MMAAGFVSLLLVGAGCTGTPEQASNAEVTIPELGVSVTAPDGYDYSRLDEGVYHLTTPGGSKTVTLQSFGPPDVPAEAIENAEGLASAFGSLFDNFDVTNQETLPNGFILDYTIDEDEAFSAVIKTPAKTILCEPEFGAFTFNFDDLKEICRSVKSSS